MNKKKIFIVFEELSFGEKLKFDKKWQTQALKSFFPKKSFLKCPFLILNIKILLQTNFYMVSKFAEHLQHFSGIDGFLKQI